jgi:hypothetical protein
MRNPRSSMEADAIMAGEDAAEIWYVRARGRIQGPLTWAQLHSLRERGQLARFDQVSRDRQNWVAADSVERLFPRSGAGGAFVAGPRVKEHSPKPASEPEPVEFLILDDDETSRPEPAPDADPVPAGLTTDEPTSWYYADAGSPQGPVSYSDLKRLAKDGRIGPATLYWRSGLDQWTTGSDLPELNRLWPFEASPDQAAQRVNLPPRSRSVEPAQTMTAPRINPLAVLSLALNLFCGIGNLAAIVAGVVALRQIDRSNGALAGKAIALAGLVLGICGLVSSLTVAFFWISGRATAPG